MSSSHILTLHRVLETFKLNLNFSHVKQIRPTVLILGNLKENEVSLAYVASSRSVWVTTLKGVGGDHQNKQTKRKVPKTPNLKFSSLVTSYFSNITATQSK